MSVKQVLLLCLLLGMLALLTCRDEGLLGPTAPDLAKGSVPPVGCVPPHTLHISSHSELSVAACREDDVAAAKCLRTSRS
jgi:hypothetical protein